MLPRSFALLLPLLSGCTTVTFSSLRPTFGPEDPVIIHCQELPNDVEEINQGLKDSARVGWRLAAVGQRTTSFFGLTSSRPVLCLEKSSGEGHSDPGRQRYRGAPTTRAPEAAQLADEDDRSADGRRAAPPAPAAAPVVPTGTLGILSVPGSAIIEFDGKEVGRSPLILRSVAVGTHRIAAKWPDGRGATLSQEVEGGKTATVHLVPAAGDAE